jgi:hypothetical protein
MAILRLNVKLFEIFNAIKKVQVRPPVIIKPTAIYPYDLRAFELTERREWS